jgi:hypothetical protein
MPGRLGQRRPDLEQAEVVVVARARQLQERGGNPRLARDHAHAEGGVVEGDAALEVGDVEHGVVEPDGGDGHGLLREWGRRCESTQKLILHQMRGQDMLDP